MIKRFNKILAGITAAAALLLAAGCKNQLDYLNDTTARNAFNVAGLYVSGLDAGYNGANVALKVVAVDANGDKSEVDYVAGTVADSYTTDKGETVGHQSGTVYIKLDEAKLYDGDKMAVDYFNANGDADDYVAFSASSIECYLQVGSDTIKVLSSDGSKLENAKLSVPTSEAGTKDADLISRWVTVNVADGVGTFALAGNASEPVNVTLPHIGLNLTTVTSASDLPAGVTINSSTDTTKATDGITNVVLTITGIPEDFKDYVMILSGADIGDSASTIETGDWHYDKTSNVFKQTVAKAEADKDDIDVKAGEYYVSYDFYGQRQTWRADCDIEMLVSDYNNGEGNHNSNNRLLDQVTENKKDTNFMLPKYLWGSKKVSITIDMNDLKNGTDYKRADPVATSGSIKLAGFVVNGLKTSETYNLIATDGDAARTFLDGLDKTQGNNADLVSLLEIWDTSAKDLEFASTYACYFPDSTIEVFPGSETFVLGFRAVPQSSDSTPTLTWNSAVAFSTTRLQTVNYMGDTEYVLYADATTGAAYLLPRENDIISTIEDYLNVDIDGYAVQGWYDDDWKALDSPKGSVKKTSTANEWIWTITTTEFKKGYRFSIIPELNTWTDRFELADNYTLTVGGQAVGPMNHNNEQTIRATVDLEASKTYTFTVNKTFEGLFIKVTKS